MKTTVRVVLRPLQSFFRLEAASGILLFVAAVLALAWANSPAHQSYEAVMTVPLTFGSGTANDGISLHTLINDGLMTIFFFVVGMEIKRELVAGELSSVRRALLPAVAAVGGMAVPAGIFLLFNPAGDGQRGWGIPMATDIAFAIGCLTLLGKRVAPALGVFLLALAIFDDIGGIIVIAVFYGHGLHLTWLVGAVGVTGVLWAMNRARVGHGFAYGVVGAALWYALLRTGIHATISGVILGLMIPASRRPKHGKQGKQEDRNDEAPLNRFIHLLHPWVAFAIMPAFALANAGVRVADGGWQVVTAPVALGTGVGLALGKPIGIMAATALAVKLGLADRPGGASWPAIFGVSVVAGIGFTVALFIATLAYPRAPDLLAEAKVGILLGSLVAGVAGMAIIRAATRASPTRP